MVQKMERHQKSAPQQVGGSPSGTNAEIPPTVEATPVTSDDPAVRRSSTPIMSEEDEEPCQADLSALESALQIIVTSESQLPELRDRTDPEMANISGAPPERTMRMLHQSVTCPLCLEWHLMSTS